MITRCYNPDNASYPTYGAVGITVCMRWREAFENFLFDMGPRPPGRTLDRFPNRDGNYEPGNVRWATSLDQARNRDDVKLTADTANEILGRLEHGERAKSVAARLGVSLALVSLIKTGRVWSELPPFQGKFRRLRPAMLTGAQIKEIIKCVENGESRASIASRFGVSKSMIGSTYRKVSRKEKPGDNSARLKGGL